MRELQDISSAAALSLSGVRLRREDRAIDRPMIVYLKYRRHGHYAVVRPVGHSGRLVQLLDPSLPPTVFEKRLLWTAPQWTGLALLPARPHWPARIATAVAAGTAAAILSAFALIHTRNSSAKRADPAKL